MCNLSIVLHEIFIRWRDESIWSMRDKSKDKSYDRNSYYGIKGVSRKPNSWIAGAAILLMGVGALFHYVAFKYVSMNSDCND